jgi:hypothetical protein
VRLEVTFHAEPGDPEGGQWRDGSTLRLDGVDDVVLVHVVEPTGTGEMRHRPGSLRLEVTGQGLRARADGLAHGAATHLTGEGHGAEVQG